MSWARGVIQCACANIGMCAPHYNYARCGTGKCESCELQKWVAIRRETEPARREFGTVNVGIGSELGLNGGMKKSDNYA